MDRHLFGVGIAHYIVDLIELIFRVIMLFSLCNNFNILLNLYKTRFFIISKNNSKMKHRNTETAKTIQPGVKPEHGLKRN